MTSSLFVVSLSILFALTAVQYTQAANFRKIWKQTFGKEGYCHLQCIHDIFAESCEGMNCTMIYEGSREDKEKKCKGDCILAVTSDRMRKCLKEGYPDKDVEDLMHVSYYHYPSNNHRRSIIILLLF